MGFLNYNGPFNQFLSKMMQLIILNLAMILFSIPLVTCGAVITAGHYAALKICRGEGYVIPNFWESFKEKF